jgi:hypothetical protein
MHLRERFLSHGGPVGALKPPVLISAIGQAAVGDVSKLAPNSFNLT